MPLVLAALTITGFPSFTIAPGATEVSRQQPLQWVPLWMISHGFINENLTVQLFFFSENSVTFFLAEKCREFQLKTFLKVIWSKISGFSFRMVYLLILSWRARRRIYPCDITTFSLFSDCQAPDWEGSHLGLHLVRRWRPLFGLDDLRGLLQP